MSPNFVHCIYLYFEPILLRRKVLGIPLRHNVYTTYFLRHIKYCSELRKFEEKLQEKLITKNAKKLFSIDLGLIYLTGTTVLIWWIKAMIFPSQKKVSWELSLSVYLLSDPPICSLLCSRKIQLFNRYEDSLSINIFNKIFLLKIVSEFLNQAVRLSKYTQSFVNSICEEFFRSDSRHGFWRNCFGQGYFNKETAHLFISCKFPNICFMDG